MVEIQHSIFVAGFNGCRQFVQPIFLDEFFHGARIDHNFQRGRHAAVHRVDHALADDGLQCAGQLAPDLLALVCLEEIENTAHGLGRVGGVQGGEHEVARIRRAHGGGKADRVTHFPDHDNVRILAQDVFERFPEG